FYQCDVDVVGTNSLLCEVELVQIAADVFKALGINVCLKINNRKILAGMAEAIGAPDKMMDITIAIDKLDKIGIDNVNAELRENGLSAEQVEALQPILGLSGDKEQKLAGLEAILTSEVGKKGIEEVRTLFGYIDELGVDIMTELDLTLARGLNYYTGAIFEVKALDTEIGSISGGGRYDNLTGIFGLDGLSGVGISFGADRIYDVMTRLDLFPSEANASTDVLVANFGGEDELYSLGVLAKMRAAGLSGEMYPESAKMKKQMGYADKRGIRFVVLCGETERLAGSVTVKDMSNGQQQTIGLDEAVALIKG
ncbi:MAG: ATP phosphoribosyltransferase regulatory subunit, partial [Bacteroidales bacterium]|nr:ATP phosphoribosyltransferase regulatory subunit [Bacteroidales bacterium]